MPCLACRKPGPSTVHHVTGSIFGFRLTRSHKRVVPLCPEHHQIQHGPRKSVEAIGHRAFFFEHGINLEEEAERLWRESDVLGLG